MVPNKKWILSWCFTSPQWRSSSPAHAQTSSRSPPSWVMGESQEPDWGLSPVPSHCWAPSAFWPYPGSVLFPPPHFCLRPLGRGQEGCAAVHPLVAVVWGQGPWGAPSSARLAAQPELQLLCKWRQRSKTVLKFRERDTVATLFLLPKN